MTKTQFFMGLSAYIVIGFLYVLWRLSDKDRYKSMMESAYRAHPSAQIVELAVPIVFLIFVITWPLQLSRLMARIAGKS
jgi:hypothetical protein